MPDDPTPSPSENEPVLARLWDIAHKYQRSLKHGDVLPLHESEGDREAVAPFAERLHTAAERNLDGLTYRSLAEMQVRRDSRRLLSNLPARLRLRRLGFELALRAKPVVFLHGPATLEATGLLAAVGYHAEQFEPEGDAAALLDELDESQFRVRMHGVGEAELVRLRTRIRERLVGRRFPARELADSLSSAEADLLSQLARRGDLTLIARPDGSLEVCDGKPAKAPIPSIAVLLRPKRHGAPRG